MKTSSFKVICQNCLSTLGVVHEVEDKKRIGFFTNKSTPPEIPTKCVCGGLPFRVTNN